ncbi:MULTISPECIES: CbtB domain-containing protein [Microtetraspora]|uniref:CbtB domain-containing protein n=1 Tax=Microtetraspora glauca TaxID=1996 RepID=A0ABV3GPE8_MICGL|nr:CbtB domain-containing protein [Microtetraspora sp. AC03309]MCC5577344.1 CbtB-domain containing protein [Microtetraspora sp. AC03309]
MSELTTSHPVPLAGLGRWLLVAVPLLLLVAYLVTFDQGAVSQAGNYLHELMHDGRHLLGVPCH